MELTKSPQQQMRILLQMYQKKYQVSDLQIKKDTGVSNVTLGQFKKGKTTLSRNNADKILDYINAPKTLHTQILNSIKIKTSYKKERQLEFGRVINASKSSLEEPLGKTESLILGIIRAEGSVNLNSISKRAKISNLLARKLLRGLEKKKMIGCSSDGELYRAVSFVFHEYRSHETAKDDDLKRRKMILRKGIQIIDYVNKNKTKYPEKNSTDHVNLAIPEEIVDDVRKMMSVYIQDLVKYIEAETPKYDDVKTYSIMNLIVPSEK